MNNTTNKINKFKSDRFTLINKLLKITSMVNNKGYLFELGILSRMTNFIKVICIKIYENNISNIESVNSGDIVESYLNLLEQLGVLSDVPNNKWIKQEVLLDYETKVSLKDDYNYICQNFHDNKEAFSTDLSQYLRSLIQYLLVLEKINLAKQIDSPLASNFYSDLGEQAFELFNKKNFEQVINTINGYNVLDIGCGNGNFIDYFLKKDNSFSVTGIEMQQDLAVLLEKKYSNFRNVKIYSDNILDLNIVAQFDIINMSYMLFYLSFTEQIKLFSSLKENLSQNGRIIVCQYFGNIEEIQIRIMKNRGKWNFIDRYKFSISQNILYAELLLNASLGTFDTLPRYDKFLELLDITGFEINEIFPADDNFYSFYFSIKPKIT